MMLPRWLARVAARRRRHLPPALVTLGLDLAALASVTGPSLVLPRYRRVLVLAPHPDDEVIGCGGTIARLAASGADVEVLLVTDGEATIGSPYDRVATAARRRAEAARSCALLGARPPVALGIPDGEVPTRCEELAAAVQEAAERVRPELILAPWPLDAHPDHRATAAALLGVAIGPADIWGYEAHSAIPAPDHVIDISSAVAHKRAALAAHETAARAFELEAVLGLARWRSLATSGGTGAAEAFVDVNALAAAPGASPA